ncbi:MAG TPA: hypothetical protein VFA83_14645 [Acidimicrobiales bacterium]|nr:hypothetical protein [Acidimicrobiales bacterium]
MQLVQRQQDTRFGIAGDLAHLDEQPGQVARQVPTVRRPVHGLDVDADLCPVGQPQAERLQHPECPGHVLPQPLLGLHGQQQPAEGTDQQRRQPALLGDLDVLVEQLPPVHLPAGQMLELVQQHGLPDPPQPGEDLAPPGPAHQHPLQGHVHGLDLPLPTDQRRRAGPGPRAVGVPHRVHSAV